MPHIICLLHRFVIGNKINPKEGEKDVEEKNSYKILLSETTVMKFLCLNGISTRLFLITVLVYLQGRVGLLKKKKKKIHFRTIFLAHDTEQY